MSVKMIAIKSWRMMGLLTLAEAAASSLVAIWMRMQVTWSRSLREEKQHKLRLPSYLLGREPCLLLLIPLVIQVKLERRRQAL